ncbi:hypothetical protein EDM56_26990 [Brevibacillus fluminis]|uniref:Uncharacterized protein n=1 Tax=Brevibacillus fluminis TaxID=511487 RepID=A0A3M8D0T8_9BACL|nr:hypothetical protein EDM56_26990 [Brevibacillus fluminis]
MLRWLFGDSGEKVGLPRVAWPAKKYERPAQAQKWNRAPKPHAARRVYLKDAHVARKMFHFCT